MPNYLRADTLTTVGDVGEIHIRCPRTLGIWGTIKAPFKPLHTIVLWCTGVSGVPELFPYDAERRQFHGQLYVWSLLFPDRLRVITGTGTEGKFAAKIYLRDSNLYQKNFIFIPFFRFLFLYLFCVMRIQPPIPPTGDSAHKPWMLWDSNLSQLVLAYNPNWYIPNPNG